MYDDSSTENPLGAVTLPQPPRVGARNHALAGDKPRATTTFAAGDPTVVSIIITGF